MKQKIRKKLFELVDPKYKEFHERLCPGTENIIGVRVPVLRKYEQELFKEKDWKHKAIQKAIESYRISDERKQKLKKSRNLR